MAARPLLPSDFGSQLALWLTSNDQSSIAVSAGTVPQWSDKSGSKRHAVATQGSLQPAYPGDSLNGKPAVKWSASGARRLDIQAIATASQLNTSALALFIIFRVGTNTGDRFPYASYNGARMEMKVSGSGLYYNFNNGDKYVANLGAAGTWVIAAVWGSGTTALPSINGTDYASSTLTAGNINGGALGTYAGGTSAPWDDNIAELIIVQSCTRAQFDQTIGYLAWDKGLQGNLPANHPYKAAAPTVDDGAAVVGRRRPMMLMAS